MPREIDMSSAFGDVDAFLAEQSPPGRVSLADAVEHYRELLAEIREALAESLRKFRAHEGGDTPAVAILAMEHHRLMEMIETHVAAFLVKASGGHDRAH